MKRRLPETYYNALSIIGTIVAATALFLFAFLYVVASVSGGMQAYEGMLLFLIVPAFLILGILLIILGMVLAARRRRRAAAASPSGRIIDLNKPEIRRATVVFGAGTLIFLLLSAFGSYKAYHYTDSVLFCGTLCHNVMEPEHTTYLNSPHARVACTQCHIGPGASWYVKSKLSGLYQVYATIANVYPRPIPTPVKNLRPARETCEQCHWPSKVYGKQQRLEIHYLSDEDNPRWDIELLLNTGAGNQALGFETGIHWHTNADVRVEYVHSDQKRQEIPRVILTNLKTNERTVYDATEKKADEAALAAFPVRTMDCIDCHNRPSHIYRSPQAFINAALAAGRIDPGLPYIKDTAVSACLEEYPTMDAARSGIAGKIRDFYGRKYPELAKGQAQRIEGAANGVIQAYSQNVFPRMRVRREAYPDNIGHLDFPGCFRCHDGRHVSTSGKVISGDCGLCHSILAQGPHGKMTYAGGGTALEFQHPSDIGDAWKESACTECHSSAPD